MNTHFNVRSKVFGGRRRTGSGSGDGTRRKPTAPPPPESPPDSLEPVLIDSLMHGEEEKMGAWLIPGIRPALVDPGPANTAENVIAALTASGIERLDSIVLTHIHFDHAGAAGHLAARYPEATVYVHSPVARHLADPVRLTDSVREVWGEETDDLFGLPVPIPKERIESLEGGDAVDLGDRRLEAILTPGHTRSHLAFLDGETGNLLCGDALGSQLPGSNVFRPATPPMDFSIEDAIESIERIRSIQAETILMAHFGPARPGPDTACQEAVGAIELWYDSYLHKREIAETDEDLRRRFHACLEATLEPVSAVARRNLELVNPAWLNIDGMSGAFERESRRHAA